jgi:hypothetical protein
MALLLVDNQYPELLTLLRCLKSNVTLVLFDFEKDTFESLSDKIPEKGYTHLGILKTPSDSGRYCLIKSFGDSIVVDVEEKDPFLDSWTSFHLLVELCVSRLGVRALDLMEPFPSKDIEYLEWEWDLPIRTLPHPVSTQSVSTQSYPWQIDTFDLYFTRDIPPKAKPAKAHEKQILYRLLYRATESR